VWSLLGTSTLDFDFSGVSLMSHSVFGKMHPEEISIIIRGTWS
jgi:hypothetical protein